MKRLTWLIALTPLLMASECESTDDIIETGDSGLSWYDGPSQLYAITAGCTDGTPDTWDFDFITDGFAGGIDVDFADTGDCHWREFEAQAELGGCDARLYTEASATAIHSEDHSLSSSHNAHWDGEASPGTPTAADAASVDPADDANNDNRPDWTGTVNFDSQTASDADGVGGSWDHWTAAMDDVATIGEIVLTGGSQTTLFDCTWDNAMAGVGGSLAFKATMRDDNGAAVDCANWGFHSDQYWETYKGDSCFCLDVDGDCTN